MAKKVVKKSKKSTKKTAKKTRKKRENTIQSVVLACLAKDPEMSVKDIYTEIKAAGHKDSKFNKSHLAWYKYQVRKGNLSLPGGKSLPPSSRGAKEPAKKAKSTKKVKKVKKAKENKKD